MASLSDVRRMVNSVKQNSDAIKALPVVRSYVDDPNKDLIRPNANGIANGLPRRICSSRAKSS